MRGTHGSITHCYFDPAFMTPHDGIRFGPETVLPEALTQELRAEHVI
ncbi:hypothetical protein [Streptomyces sp. NPDC048710]